MTPSDTQQPGSEAATQLLARRAQLQDWLNRLDTVQDDIPAQVKRRVRADYEQRLESVVAELSAHSESLSADREALDERLLAAAERHDAAHDALEESRLRHLIGELSGEEWEARRPGLEEELETARTERGETEREIAALEDLLGQLGVGTSASAPAEQASEDVVIPADELTVESPAVAASPEPEDFADAADEWDPELPEIEVPSDWRPEAEAETEPEESVQPAAGQADEEEEDEDELPIMGDPFAPATSDETPADHDLVEITTFAAAAEALAEEVDPGSGDDDYAFLQELDRAIAATAPAGGGEEPEPDTRPQPGLKCPDCGYSNDPAAWYCGVCGVDLG